VSID